MGSFITLAQRRFLRDLAEALFDGFEELAIPIDKIVENFELTIDLIGGRQKLEVAAAVGGLQLLVGFDFNHLTPGERRQLIEDRLALSEWDLVQDLAKIRALMYAAYYGHWEPGGQEGNRTNPVHRQIGFTLPAHRDRTAPGEIPIEHVDGSELKPAHFVTTAAPLDDIDVIVVGSGSGGSVAARNLACHGHKVLIVEAGSHYPWRAITHEERRMTAGLYKQGALQSTTDFDVILFQGRNVGGSPTVNNGICLRMKGDRLSHPHAADVFARWSALGAPLDEYRFQRSYDAVQSYLRIGEAEPRSGRGNGRHLLDSWTRFAATSDDPLVRDAPSGWFFKNFGPPGTGSACAYCGYCNTGCRYGRRLGMAESYLPDACERGARILAQTKAERLLWRRGDGNRRRAAGVVVQGPDGDTRVIQARKGVVVAAGAIASSVLLDRSGVEGTGRDISLNIASPVAALMPAGRSPSWNEDQMTSVVDCGEYLIESHFQPPMSMASLLSGWFGEMDRRMRAYNRQVSAGILFPADRRGRLKGGRLKFKLEEQDLELLRRALATLTRVHFAGGAEEVWPPLLKGQTLRRDSAIDIDGFYRTAVGEPDDVTLSSSHPHGGNPMNKDPAKGVVDLDCRVHGTENVLVTDASVFPSCIRVNAQFTTMAMAQYATESDPFAATPLPTGAEAAA